jgi:hypothetical protein
MTETTDPKEPADTGVPSELAGVDLARVALRQAREAARRHGDGEAHAPRRRRPTVVRRDRREPAGFAVVLQGLMADRAWEVPAAGGSVLDRWPDIAAAVSPQLPSHVTAVAFHPETGQLDLRPDSPAYATQLRLISARIVATANQAASMDAVRSVRVLAVGAPTEPRRAPGSAPAAAGEPPVKTRDTASPGYRAALAAHQSVAPARRVAPGIPEAVERQTRAMRELSRRAFPEPDAALDDQPTPIEAARIQRRRQAAATETATLRRARAERAQRKSGAGPVAPGSASLRTTA